MRSAVWSPHKLPMQMSKDFTALQLPQADTGATLNSRQPSTNENFASVVPRSCSGRTLSDCRFDFRCTSRPNVFPCCALQLQRADAGAALSESEVRDEVAGEMRELLCQMEANYKVRARLQTASSCEVLPDGGSTWACHSLLSCRAHCEQKDSNQSIARWQRHVVHYEDVTFPSAKSS